MATVLPNGYIQFKDGRLLYDDTILNGKDFLELAALLPKINPLLGRAGMVGFPFGGGGGGGSGPGTPGAAGTPGAVGATGLQGPTGPSGGAQGATGLVGPQGATGVQGIQGGTGIQGVTGIQGATGVRGATGVGTQGVTGLPGTAAGAVQNSIISARKSGANIDFLSVGAGLSVTLLATATPFVYDINGTKFTVAADAAITITNNANNFIWIDDTGATGVTTLPCMYSYTAPAGVTGQHWFDLGDNHMKVWNGAAFVNTNRIFIGYVRADGGTADARYACEPNLLGPEERFNRYGDGNLGFLEVSAGTTTLAVGLRNYSAVVVRGTGTLTYADTDGQSAALEILAQGILIVLGTGKITAKGLGLPGGAGGATAVDGTSGEGGGLGGAGGGGGSGVNPGGAGGGHGAGQRFPSTTQFVTLLIQRLVYWGGGAAGSGGVGGAGSGNGIATGFSVPVLFGAGNGGGGGGATNGAGPVGGDGGAGGGLLLIVAASIAISATASILVDANDGANGTGANSGGGGGGGGGTLLAYSRVFQNSGTFTASAGAAGASGGGGSGFAGGAGAAGAAVHVYN